MKLVKKPMLMLHAELDNYAPTIDCINYVKLLKENGNDIELKIYKGAHHGFIKVQETKVFQISEILNIVSLVMLLMRDTGFTITKNGKI